MIIEIIKIIASVALSVAFFYVFRKVGRQEVLNDLIKNLSEANNLIGKQEALIQVYKQDLVRAESSTLIIDYDPSVHAKDFIASLITLFEHYGDKPVLIGETGLTSIVYSEKDEVFMPLCSPDLPPLKACELSTLTKQLVQKYGNLSVETQSLFLLDITYDKDDDVFRIRI